jgi:23S rRNA (cytosine1962-C5)-methyltransferase
MLFYDDSNCMTTAKPNNLPALRLRREARRARVLNGHPWVYINELDAIPEDLADGSGVNLFDARGRSLGSGILNRHSQIAWRRYSRQTGIAFSAEYLSKAIAAAIERRAEETVRRLIWSDADHLPGLVVDQFEDVLVVQALTLAVEQQEAAIIECLRKQLQPTEILFRNDAPVRKLEGLELEVKTLSGKPLAPRDYEIDSLSYELDLANAQKTGFYLDQREQHILVASLSEGRRVLDGFCNQGAFGLQALNAGAESALSIDASATCCAAARQNAERNELPLEVLEANLFDYMKTLERGAFDCIILDPPSFARNKQSVPGALRGYKELNLRALQCLPPGGILATYSCSQHIDAATFEATLVNAAADAQRELRLFARTSQPFDHPILLNFPESNYLKGLIIQVE